MKSIKPSTFKSKSTQSIITFKNSQKLLLNESTYVLEKQLQRTSY
ncbi:competence protein ComK [Bacillus oleivorans]|nr:competence protein ComK [Bacillus oleivorans]